jgi:hypothetical protein
MSFLQKGKRVEQAFAEFFEFFEWPSTHEDIHEHWDLEVLEDGKWYKYDVKGLKKVKRYDKKADETIHWIELKNVHGNLGWLYGEANRFAFELTDYFMVVDKLKLQEFIKDKCQKKLVKFPTPYKFYRRKDRQDLLTLVKSFDMMMICEYILRKEDGKKIKITFEDYVVATEEHLEGSEI